MRRLIAKGLRARPMRFALCVGGIAVSTLLVLVLFASYRSVAASIRRYTGQRGLDIWVGAKGTDNLIRSSGVFDVTTLEEVRRVPGVARVDPILRAFVTAEAKGRRFTLLGVSFRAPNGLGGPPLLERGRTPAASGEVALDQSAAHRLRINIGDMLAVNGVSMKVVGITSGTNLLATQFVFGKIDLDGPGALPLASFGIVEVAAGANASDVFCQGRCHLRIRITLTRSAIKKPP